MSATAAAVARERARSGPESGRIGRGVSILGVWLLLAALALSTLYPVVFLTLTSFRTDSDYLRSPIGLPKAWTLDNISHAYSGSEIGHYALNSFIAVSIAVLLLTVVTCLAGFAFTQFEFPLRRAIFVVVVGMMALPPSVLMIPIFKVILDLNLLNKRTGLVLVYTSLNLPFSIYLMSSYMRSLPSELIHAARVDGAGTLRILWSIVLPLVRPGLLTLVTLNFLILWNELLFSLLIMQDEQGRTIMVGIAQAQGQYQTHVGVIAGGLLLSMIPPLLIFALFQRDLARGLTAGALK
ncbi:MAG: multiple sugar transport system permease protein [Solirubrobacteraceae bacterium]